MYFGASFGSEPDLGTYTFAVLGTIERILFTVSRARSRRIQAAPTLDALPAERHTNAGWFRCLNRGHELLDAYRARPGPVGKFDYRSPSQILVRPGTCGFESAAGHLDPPPAGSGRWPILSLVQGWHQHSASLLDIEVRGVQQWPTAPLSDQLRLSRQKGYCLLLFNVS